MVVDDDFALRLPMKLTLENANFSVIEAENGQEAIDNFKSQKPDLIMLDFVMPGIDGFKTCQKIRNLPGGRHVPIIMVTSLEDVKTIDSAFQVGATDFIAKPINLNILAHRARYWLRSGTMLSDLNVSQQRLAKAQRLARLAHWELDLENNRFRFSTEVADVFGITDLSRYEALFENIIPDDKEQVKAQIDNACKTKSSFTINYRVKLKNGDKRVILNQGEIVLNEITNTPQLIGIVQDITELKKAEDQIRYLAFYDNLTGLANRALLKEHWLKIASHALRNDEKVAVFFIDLDHFKRVNDTLGHSAGDQLLITVAKRIKKELRTSDVIASSVKKGASTLVSRVGGDEFIVLASHIKSSNHISYIAQRVIESLEQPLHIENHEIAVSASMGISIFPDDGREIELLLKSADTAMYEAKETGRNNYKFFQSKMNDAAQARFILGNKLRRAMERNEFLLYYQPQYCTETKKMTGVEALIRWNDPEKGLIPPNTFLPFAEESGLIHKINSWVIKRACTEASNWVTSGLFENCRVAVNISGHKINFEHLADEIMMVLKESYLEPQYFELELTERVMMENTDEVVPAVLRLKEAGITIAIDDFGTGYSSLSHLRIFPLSKLKIDKSFVDNISTSPKESSLLNSIIAIAKSFELTVIAEGVETNAQLQVLEDMGCDEIQGYLLSTPLAVNKLEEKVLIPANENNTESGTALRA